MRDKKASSQVAINPRSARESKNLRREELASLAKVSLGTVAVCEQQNRWPTQTFVRNRYLTALGLTEADLVGGK